MIRETEEKALMQAAEAMVLAAVTAPKGRGEDNLEIAILETEDIQAVADEMERLGQEKDVPSFLRDARNIKHHAKLAVLIGTRVKPLNLKYCGFCGFENCAANQAAGAVCAFNTGDLGIAIGSAAAVAASRHADNRIMYTMGMAALSLKLLGEGVKIAYGIPLSAAGKNPFFDRK